MITLYAAWVLSRIWRMLDVLIFKSIHDQSKRSLQESQYAALLVNSNAPFNALFAAGRLMQRRGPRRTLTKIALASLLVLLLTAATPLLIARFPAFHAGLIAPTDCGYHSNNASLHGWSYLILKRRFADATFLSVDQNGTKSAPGGSRRTTNLAPLPSPTQSYVRQCPAGATCHPDYPFTFSSDYTLTSKHFGLNLDTPFSIRVSDTCYRPIQAHAQINTSDSVRYCLKYGTVNTTLPEIRDCVSVVSPAHRASPVYSLESLSALTDYSDHLHQTWTPNSSLVLGGDTTILIYFVGGISQSQPSDDPIFPTNTTPNVMG